MGRIIRLFFNFGISYDHFAEQAFPLVLQNSNVQFLYTAMRDTWVEWNVALKHFNGCYCDILFYFFALSPPSSAYSWHFPTITITIIIIYPSTKKYHSRGRNFITSLKRHPFGRHGSGQWRERTFRRQGDIYNQWCGGSTGSKNGSSYSIDLVT